MSNSDLSDAPTSKVPLDGALEKALRKETSVQFEDTSKSINSIRKGAEESLGLRTGFFVDDEGWKARSKEIIKAALVSQYCLRDIAIANISSGRTS